MSDTLPPDCLTIDQLIQRIDAAHHAAHPLPPRRPAPLCAGGGHEWIMARHGGEYPDRVDICQCRHCGALHPNQTTQEGQ